MPYQNAPDLQKLITRHLNRGNEMKSFVLHTGKTTNKYRNKANLTAKTLQNLSKVDMNRSYGEKLG